MIIDMITLQARALPKHILLRCVSWPSTLNFHYSWNCKPILLLISVLTNTSRCFSRIGHLDREVKGKWKQSVFFVYYIKGFLQELTLYVKIKLLNITTTTTCRRQRTWYFCRFLATVLAKIIVSTWQLIVTRYAVFDLVKLPKTGTVVVRSSTSWKHGN